MTDFLKAPMPDLSGNKELSVNKYFDRLMRDGGSLSGFEQFIASETHKARKEELKQMAQVLPTEPPKMDIAVVDTGRAFQRYLNARLAELEGEEQGNE